MRKESKVNSFLTQLWEKQLGSVSINLHTFKPLREFRFIIQSKSYRMSMGIYDRFFNYKKNEKTRNS